MNRKWMYGGRNTDVYEGGVKAFIAAAKEDMLREGRTDTYCPCVDCDNLRMFEPRQIEYHLFRRGFKKEYECWSKHGEEQTTVSHDDIMLADEEATDMTFDFDRDSDVEDSMPDLEQMLRDFEGQENDKGYQQFVGLMEASEKPLFPGCKAKFTVLSATLELLKLKASNGWSDRSFNALLGLLGDMMPEGNELPMNTYRAKKVLCPLGLEVEKIHACRNDCILYRKRFADLHSCPVCGASRYKDKSKLEEGEESVEVTKGIPGKVCWYLPIIPRLKRLFANPKEAKLMRWHAEERKTSDGKLRHPADAVQWRNIDRKHPVFGDEARNIRFGLSTDGMNPFGNMSSRHSTWPVLLCIYNLPPWLCMKRKYIMMSVLIQGPKQPGNDIDVYFALLMDDLQTLWNPGVPQVWDADRREYFTLRSLLFCTIQDFPALGNTSGQTVKGHKGCVICIENTVSLHLKYYGKVVYMGHRRFLPVGHRYRGMKKQFNGKMERGVKPRPFTGREIFEKVKDLNVVLGKGRKKKAGVKDLWKKRSIFWELPYWKDLDVRHCIDVMHIEKNVCDSVLGLLLNIKDKTKDGVKARLDMVDMGIRPELAPIEMENGRIYIPPACYTLSKAERNDFCKFLHGVKVPSGYSANIKKLVSMQDLKLIGMKSHDCHVMMTQMLPVAIRNILPTDVREAIMSLCFFFNNISQKVMDVLELDALELRAAVTLCQLEMFFPPSFFDIMVHLTVHIVHEIKMCGPVFLRSMYPFERFMGILKHYVRNKARPEGSIVEGYAAEEVVEFCVDYMAQNQPIGVPRSRHEGRLDGVGIIGKKVITADQDGHAVAHFMVLQHTTAVAPYLLEHREKIRQDHPKKSDAWTTREHNKQFSKWFKERLRTGPTSDMLTWYAKEPTFTVVTWQGYDINGYTFYTRNQDEKSTYQNSAVRIEAFDTAGNRSWYYGFIEDIWELDYVHFKIPLFRCRWVNLSHTKVDKYGFTTVDLGRVGYKDDPFILANQAHQIFYVTDPANKNLHIVMHGKRKIVGVENVVDEDEYKIFEESPPIDRHVRVDQNEPDEGRYIRDDHDEGLEFATEEEVPRKKKKKRKQRR